MDKLVDSSVRGAKPYGWQSERPAEHYSYVAPKILEIISSLKVSRILDLGAGNGLLCADLAKRGNDVVGVESDVQGVQIARAQYPGIRFYRTAIEDGASLLMSEQQAFDLVVATEVIEHLYSPRLLLEFAQTCLRPDGWLMLSTPYHGFLKNLALSVSSQWDKHLDPLWEGGHIKFWSRATLTQLLHDNGFEVQAFFGVGRMPYLWKSMIMVAKLRRS
jgi:2-polyprenyl-3-methyl-5-hydroxy-6-metoxy-1,4-benzoquinol methylase